MASVSKIVLISGAKTASENGSTKTLELLSGDFIGYLHVSAIHAATTVNAKIQHSADGTNWIDLVSFSALAGVTGFERKLIEEAVLPYIRGVATLSGATQSSTLEISFFHDKKR